jgi:tetratricopeptide (TPR) repeat protein
MWWLWPHFKRLWAGVGTLIAGLTVTYVYNLWSKQAVPDLRSAFSVLHDYWAWAGSALLALMAVSFAAERAHRKHEVRAPQSLRVAQRSWREPLRRHALPIPSGTTNLSTIVGRAAELAKINDWFTQIKTGTRRVVFVSGEPGIGKTTLARAFLDSVAGDRGVCIGRGQCVEQYGAGEPYMPILEALTRLCREPNGNRLVEILHRMAPAWLAQMPSLVSAEDRVRLQGQTQGTTQHRMLREMAEALEVIAADTPCLLLLEDLHWSDPSTLDLIATVARRSEPAQLMILGTYRPVERLQGEHPLLAMKEELELHQQCIELRLSLLSEADVAAYLAQRLDEKKSLASSIYRRTEGNPLFMVNVVDYLLEHGSLLEADTIEAPRNIRQMIDRNLQRLTPDEQRVLEAASVLGAEFSAAAVAAALERSVSEIEACCAGLARREQFITKQGFTNWPDGTVASNFRFHHALYQDVLYDRLPEGHRVRFHRRVAEREEAAYGEDAKEIAAELAHHYGRANNPAKTVDYLSFAARQAQSRSAFVEVLAHARAAIALIPSLAKNIGRGKREFALLTMLATAATAIEGWGSATTTEACRRMLELARESGDEAELLTALEGSRVDHYSAARHGEAVEAARQMLAVAEKKGNPVTLADAHHALGFALFWTGNCAAALSEFNQAIKLCPDGVGRFSLNAQEALTESLLYAALSNWAVGYPERAVNLAQSGVERARSMKQPFLLSFALFFSIWVRSWRREALETQHLLEELQGLAEPAGFVSWTAMVRLYGGWIASMNGEHDRGVALIRSGITDWKRPAMFTLFSSVLAEACRRAGRYEEAMETVAVGRDHAHRTGEHFSESEIERIAGETLFQMGAEKAAEAERRIRRAVAIAVDQGAKSFELRATISLARYLGDTGRRDEARAMLSEIYGWFTEGFDTADLKDAKALLDELSG